MHPSSPNAAGSDGLRMLIADDDRDAAETLAMFMEMEGHSVHLAHDGAQALALAQRVQPHVSILDIGMPRLDGHSVAQGLRASVRGTRMLILALSGQDPPTDRERSQQAGFDHHFVKPVRLSELQACIARWLETGGDEHLG